MQLVFCVHDERERPSRTESRRVGDGTFMFGPPTSVRAGRNVLDPPGKVPKDRKSADECAYSGNRAR